MFLLVSKSKILLSKKCIFYNQCFIFTSFKLSKTTVHVGWIQIPASIRMDPTGSATLTIEHMYKHSPPYVIGQP